MLLVAFCALFTRVFLEDVPELCRPDYPGSPYTPSPFNPKPPTRSPVSVLINIYIFFRKFYNTRFSFIKK